MACLLFDLDGTLVESELLCNQAFINLLPELNESAATLMSRYRGIKLSHTLDDIQIRLGHNLPDDFETVYRAEVARLFNSHLEPVPGAGKALAQLANPKCIASSGPTTKIQHSLQLTDLATFFGDRVFSSYEIESWKPEPDLFLHAAKVMGHQPANCVVIEDSQVGLEAAQAAGMRSILYCPSGEPASDLADLVLTNMADLPSLVASLK